MDAIWTLMGLKLSGINDIACPGTGTQLRRSHVNCWDYLLLAFYFDTQHHRIDQSLDILVLCVYFISRSFFL